LRVRAQYRSKLMLVSAASHTQEVDVASDTAASMLGIVPGTRTRMPLRSSRRSLSPAGLLLLIHTVIIGANVLVAIRGMLIWQMVQRFRVVEWIHRIQPHMPTTIRTVRLWNLFVSGVCFPFRAVTVLPGARRVGIIARNAWVGLRGTLAAVRSWRVHMQRRLPSPAGYPQGAALAM